MKYMILILIIFINTILLSAEWIIEATAKINIILKLHLPGGATYSSFEEWGQQR